MRSNDLRKCGCGGIPAEQGALIMKALELAMQRACQSLRARVVQDKAGVTAVT